MMKKKKQRFASFQALDSNQLQSNEKEDGEDQVEILEDDQSGTGWKTVLLIHLDL